ncbi:DUF4853 domain-containing protein [Gulosibacter macacae]|uniref:DUF4853 domain-containing protein n=1 Tax=Gulosibacter macacae TaxID=2488791 RepID=UPI00163AFCE4|nr:DUF4853 domain-containing protein [Gulosibacter macacae]
MFEEFRLDGDAPISQRETLDSYAERVLPVIDDFQRSVSAAGAGELRVGEREVPRFPATMCGDDGYLIRARAALGELVPLETLISLGNERFLPLGFSGPRVTERENGKTDLYWFDKENGGAVSVIHAPGSHIGIGSESGCRILNADVNDFRAELAANYPYEPGFTRPN